MGKVRIMIVDDDPTSLAIGRAILEKEYELVLARSGLQALGYLKGGALPDLILLDMRMPGISGMEVLSTLKGSEELREIPVIFLTAEDDLEEEIISYRNGAADFLMKPVNPEMLRIKIRRQLFYLKIQRENRQLKNCLRNIKEQLERMPASMLEKLGQDAE